MMYMYMDKSLWTIKHTTASLSADYRGTQTRLTTQNLSGPTRTLVGVTVKRVHFISSAENILFWQFLSDNKGCLEVYNIVLLFPQPQYQLMVHCTYCCK